MSDRTSCCYCHLKRIKERVKGTGARVYVRSGNSRFGLPGGYNAFVVMKGEKLETGIDEKGNHGPQWVAWLMELSDHCVC